MLSRGQAEGIPGGVVGLPRANPGMQLPNQIPLPNPVREVPNTSFDWARQQMALVQQYLTVARPGAIQMLQNLSHYSSADMDKAVTAWFALATQLRVYQRPSEASDLEHLASQVRVASLPGPLVPPDQLSLPVYPNAVVVTTDQQLESDLIFPPDFQVSGDQVSFNNSTHFWESNFWPRRTLPKGTIVRLYPGFNPMKMLDFPGMYLPVMSPAVGMMQVSALRWRNS